MRMRKKPNLAPRMERCTQWWIRDPEAHRGAWRALAPQCSRLWVEVGCGKGGFTVKTAQANPDLLIIALERVPEAMVVAMEKAKELGLRNVFFVDIDVARIEECFIPGELDGMFINFCDPWPRKKNAKRRLTHRNFLEKYSHVLKDGGQVHFKTDNAPLFQFSLEEFQALELARQPNHLESPCQRPPGHHDRLRGEILPAADAHLPLRSDHAPCHTPHRFSGDAGKFLIFSKNIQVFALVKWGKTGYSQTVGCDAKGGCA